MQCVRVYHNKQQQQPLRPNLAQAGSRALGVRGHKYPKIYGDYWSVPLLGLWVGRTKPL